MNRKEVCLVISLNFLTGSDIKVNRKGFEDWCVFLQVILALRQLCRACLDTLQASFVQNCSSNTSCDTFFECPNNLAYVLVG